MYDLSHTEKDGCIPEITCGTSKFFNIFSIFYLEYSKIFFMSFILIITYVMLNLFVLIIINDFEENHSKSNK